MPGKRTAGRFRENEIARAVRAAIKGGAKIKAIIIGQDTVRIECGEPDTGSTGTTEWDEMYGTDPSKIR